jgi:hypothetical protein
MIIQGDYPDFAELKSNRQYALEQDRASKRFTSTQDVYL